MTAYLEDASGNSTTSSDVNITKDTVAPTIAMATPADGSLLGSADDSTTYSVSGTCSEATQTVSIEIGGSAATTPVGFVCDGTSFTGTIDTTGAADGSHAFTAKVSDAAGNETISSANNITKDTTNSNYCNNNSC